MATLFNQATALRSQLGNLINGSTKEQRIAAARKLYKLDDAATWPEAWRQSRAYVGNVNLCESGDGVGAWLGEQLNARLYHGAGTLLRQRGPATGAEARVEMELVQQCIEELTLAGAVAPASDPLQDAFRECGGSVSYI